MLKYDGFKDRDVIARSDDIGIFRSAECIDILKSADIVMINPTFSLFRGLIGT